MSWVSFLTGMSIPTYSFPRTLHSHNWPWNDLVTTFLQVLQVSQGLQGTLFCTFQFTGVNKTIKSLSFTMDHPWNLMINRMYLSLTIQEIRLSFSLCVSKISNRNVGFEFERRSRVIGRLLQQVQGSLYHVSRSTRHSRSLCGSVDLFQNHLQSGQEIDYLFLGGESSLFFTGRSQMKVQTLLLLGRKFCRTDVSRFIINSLQKYAT